jgi:riboflavin synthase
MFTGLVQATGRIVELRRRGRGLRLCVQPLAWAHTPAQGDSIAVSGCCLTVAAPVDPGRPIFAFDVVQETLSKTKLGSLKLGSRVNLEHAATASTLMGGHLVQGHVDGVAEVESVKRGDDWRVRIAIPEAAAGRSDPSAGDLMQYIIPKGSVCVDGTSLTVAALWTAAATARRPGRRGFEVALIPETLVKTTLKGLRRGEPINLEVDCMAKTVVHWLRHFASQAEAKAPIERPVRRSRPRARK